MPKTNILDRLNKILKTRQNALNRFNRRSAEADRFFGQRDIDWYDGGADALKYAPEDCKKTYENLRSSEREARTLIDDLNDAAGIEYDRIIRSKPGKRIEQEAFRMMPRLSCPR